MAEDYGICLMIYIRNCEVAVVQGYNNEKETIFSRQYCINQNIEYMIHKKQLDNRSISK